MKTDRSCWSCVFNRLGGGTFFGICSYFERMNKPAREIPASVADDGCKFHKPKPQEEA